MFIIIDIMTAIISNTYIYIDDNNNDIFIV